MARVLIAYGPTKIGRDRQGKPRLEEHILSTVRDVEQALHEKGHRTEKAALRRDPRPFVGAVKRFRPDVLFNLCEQVGGDASLERNAVALFEMLRVPFTGNPLMALGMCQQKALTKRLLRSARIPTPEFGLVEMGGKLDGPFALPAIVKPALSDGSLGITARSVVKSMHALHGRVEHVHRRFGQAALVERFISGREVQVALLGNERPRILPAAELSYRGLPRRMPRICSYSAKWSPGSAYYRHTNPVIPAKLPDRARRRVLQAALDTFRLFGLRGYARIDFRVRRDVPFVIDVNPNPDISADAGLARAARHARLTYGDLIDAIVRLALE